MKLSSKPISSPGRAEKYPPPLMKFLRSNVGSRSRGRSRASPMFIRKKNNNNNNNTTIETQEPSSPKVTCMGQVRVNRSKKTGSKPVRHRAPTRQRRSRCKWIKNALFCHHFPWKIKAKPGFRCSWKIWGAFFHMRSCRKQKNGKDSSKFGIKTEDSVQEEENESEEDEKEAKIFTSSCSSPPKNALILTRCQSAPYRCSSLACRFWGSPLANKEETELENRGFNEEREEDENPTSEKESICSNSDQGTQIYSETGENLGFRKAFEEKKLEKSEKGEELKTGEFVDVRPLILTRCKSEPARTSERLNPEMSFWKKRILGFT